MADLNIIHIDQQTRKVYFKLNKVPVKTTGLESLVQLCAKTILTTPGRDFLRPEYGGSILAIQGTTLNADKLPKLYTDIAYIVTHSEELILQEQVDKLINASERLKSLKLLNISTNIEKSALEVDVLVTSTLGKSANFTFNTSYSN